MTMADRPLRTLATGRGIGCLARADESPGVVSYETWVKAHAARQGVPLGLIRAPADVDRKAAPAIAYLNHGDWLADCPDGCGGAEMVEPGWPFMCANCGNTMLAGHWRRVRWPTGVLRRAVEREVCKRPFDRNRSWNRGELVKHLRRENAAHGLDDIPAGLAADLEKARLRRRGGP